ncbi:hypothetical protein Tco_0689330 [Tanacetum coccineum]
MFVREGTRVRLRRYSRASLKYPEHGPWDFNEVRNKEDRQNTQFQEKEADNFNNFITTATLMEIPLGAIALDRKESYHYQIVLKDIFVDFGPKPFRVFDIWLRILLWSRVVVEAWASCLDQNIDEYRRDAVRWEVEAESRILDETEMTRDENSKYFHAIIKRHNNKNNIRGMLVNEVWSEEPGKIKREVFEYYKSIFSEEARERPKFQNNNLGKLSADDPSRLEAPFSESEVWEAVKGCGSDKAPGPDGFNFKFINKFWGVIKEDVMRLVQWFWDRGEISKGCNASFVTLIPKTTDPIGLADFRPISLIGSYYKILTKMLAKRVKKVVGNVIGDVQNAFIGGRFILDGVLDRLTRTINYLRKNK